jgi:hypothetical protein
VSGEHRAAYLVWREVDDAREDVADLCLEHIGPWMANHEGHFIGQWAARRYSPSSQGRCEFYDDDAGPHRP